MSSLLSQFEQLLFGVFPYLVFFTFLLVTIQRYQAQSFTYSSLSSQFLENQKHFWGMVPFHYGILTVLAGHLIGFLMPEKLIDWNRVSWRLYSLEGFGLITSLLTLIGLLVLIVRRRYIRKLTIVTTRSDWILMLLLLFQVVGGIYVAIFHRWGSTWYATSIAPYLWSLFKLHPELGYITGMPVMVKLHILNAFAILAFFPFTRLVHILVVPNQYLWRKTQLVRWYRDRRRSGTVV